MITMVYILDMHIHSKYSPDSIAEPKEIVKTAIKKSLSAIAITDHNTIKGGLETKKFETPKCKVIVGAEIMTDHGEIIGLFLNKEIKATALLEVIDEINNQGGIVIVPHPFDKSRKSAFNITEEYASKVDCIECFNGRCIKDEYNLNALNFSKKYNITPVGGSDAHHLWEIGNAYTFINDDDIIKALIDNNTRIYCVQRHGVKRLADHALTKAVKKCRKIIT
jgi:predicted metal-dependent phosphoesterase TrpH